MVLEEWDKTRGKWLMYRSAADHHADCERHPLEDIPERIFLDTNIVNLIVKHAPVIFEMEPQDPNLPIARRRDIEALAHIFAVGARASWTLRVAETTLDEINRTLHEQVRQDLASYALEMLERGTDESARGSDLGRRVADSTLLALLPDRADRKLLGNAIGLGCDAFVTADVRTIVSRRHLLPTLPLRILTPTEWWAAIKPWGGLWL
ncbi:MULTISPECIES: hypothetical protein [unclassified Novosphingobium]|uniref:PIN domain-containing protein n=1 Tax=unclassified Novosphingobium TaxID=2644732 RepID=UPI00146CAA77|nr:MULTISPECIES: hypothetical protein [unclassified Novosphingobium]NMN06704.1 hypothetical protein [Novosphingobium sp. SG919]NMN88845.1 hypothetical protein [Novosphingobium sp. SG916]